MPASEAIYYLQATCISDNIDVFFANSLYLQKSEVALIVVLIDLGVTFIFYMSFIYLKNMQNIIQVEVNDTVVTASDFAVQIDSLPPHSNMKELKSRVWTFIEQVNLREPRTLQNPQTHIDDPNQNAVSEVNFGLNDYGRLQFMLRMAQQLSEKKKYDTLVRKNPEKRDQYAAKVAELNKTALDQLKEMEDYSKDHKQQAVVAYCQFQSMNGQQKFLKAMRLSAKQRCSVLCCGNRKGREHKL